MVRGREQDELGGWPLVAPVVGMTGMDMAVDVSVLIVVVLAPVMVVAAVMVVVVVLVGGGRVGGSRGTGARSHARKPQERPRTRRHPNFHAAPMSPMPRLPKHRCPSTRLESVQLSQPMINAPAHCLAGDLSGLGMGRTGSCFSLTKRHVELPVIYLYRAPDPGCAQHDHEHAQTRASRSSVIESTVQGAGWIAQKVA